MKKLVLKLTLIIIILLFITNPIVFGYANDLFKFNLPESYKENKMLNKYVFIDSNNSSRAMLIETRSSSGLKKSIWKISQSDLDDLIRRLSVTGNVIETDKRAKLGKEKAVRVVLESGGEYLEMYCLASNKYIYVVGFMGNSISDLENSDYQMIKKSFKLKDRTTNPIVVYILIAIVVVGIRLFINSKLKNKMIYNKQQNKEPLHKINSEDIDPIQDENYEIDDDELN